MTDTAAPTATTDPIDNTAHYGTGGALDKTGFAWAVFEWARNPYYILIVIYIFAPYFARDVIGADIWPAVSWMAWTPRPPVERRMPAARPPSHR